MAFDYVRANRYQELLLPTCMADWLEEGHLAWFVIEVVAKLDTATLHDRHPNDGVGRPAYDPDMMLALLLYAYATGIRFSRRIEAACRTDAAFRVITGGLTPDHATIARFVVDHEAAMAGLFVSGLRLCSAAGLIDLSWVAIDGTKMGADAALRSNRSAEWIRAQVEALIKATKDSETAEPGAPEPGADPLSAAQIRGAKARLARLEQALAVIEAEDAAEAEEVAAKTEHAAEEAAEGRKLRGRKPKDPPAALARARADLAGAEARLRAKTQARAAAAAAGRPIGPEGYGIARAEQARDRAAQALEKATAAAAEAPPPPRKANVTDADSRIMKTRKGFLQGYNAQAAVDANQIVVGQLVSQDTNDVQLLAPMLKTLDEAIAAGVIPDEIDKILADAGYWSDDNAKLARNLLIATLKDWKQRKAAREAGTTTGDPPEGASLLEAMEHRLRTAEGAAAYAKRSSTVEPVFGNGKENRGFTKFRRRGLAAAQSEWAFMSLTQNIAKLFSHWTPGCLDLG